MAECAKKGERSLLGLRAFIWGPIFTIGWKLWEKTSKKTQKELDNHYIDRRGWLSLPKRAKNHLWDWGLSYEAPFVTIVWKLWEKTSQNSQKAPLDIILSLEIQCKFADTYVKRKTLSQRTKFFDFFVHKSTWNSTKSRFSRGQKVTKSDRGRGVWAIK